MGFLCWGINQDVALMSGLVKLNEVIYERSRHKEESADERLFLIVFMKKRLLGLWFFSDTDRIVLGRFFCRVANELWPELGLVDLDSGSRTKFLTDLKRRPELSENELRALNLYSKSRFNRSTL